MNPNSIEKPASYPALLVRAGTCICALPLSHIVETMRPLAVAPLPGMPEFVRGLSIIRGEPVPVVDAGTLLGAPSGQPPQRYVTVRAGERKVALAVDAVVGVRELEPSLLGEMPPLLGNAGSDLIESLGVLDADLLMVLKAGSIVPIGLWNLLVDPEARG